MKRTIITLAAVAFGLAATTAAQAAPDAAKGKQAYGQCAACHKVDATGKSTIGPNLFKVAGRTSGTLAGFNYSPAMKAAKRVWNDKALDAYLAAPLTSMPGNKMPFAGVKNPADRANLIAYLKTLK